MNKEIKNKRQFMVSNSQEHQGVKCKKNPKIMNDASDADLVAAAFLMPNWFRGGNSHRTDQRNEMDW